MTTPTATELTARYAATATELASIYVATLNGPADAWGQHCHPTYGASHWIMLRLIQMVGSAETTRLIKLANADHAATKPGFTCTWCGVRNNNDAVSCIHCNGV